MDWAKNPDVLELQAYNRQAKQAACSHPGLMGPAWDALCVHCFKRLDYDEAVEAYERLSQTEAANG